MAYNPFNTELHNLDWNDLSVLNSVSEGFYIDYKRQLSQNNSKTAKEISSFANTDGGLLVVGVDEANDNTADSFLGVDISTHDPKVRIRNIIQSHINPAPDFEIFVIEKPNDPDKGIVLVSIPRSIDAPHVTKDGKIYRRMGEGSDPFDFETDAKIIDRLHERGEKFDEQMSEFCVPDTGVTKGKSDSTFVEIYSVPSTKRLNTCKEIVEDLSKFEDIAQNRDRTLTLLEGSDNETELNIETENFFDSILSTSDGIVAQKWVHSDGNGNVDYAYAPLTFKFFANGSLKIRMPAPNYLPHPGPEEMRNGENLHSVWNKIFDAFQDDYMSISYLKGDELVDSILLLLDLYLELLEESNWFEEQAGRLHFKGIIRNSFRNMAIFQTEWYEDIIESNGPPVSYDNEVLVPELGYMELDSSDKSGEFLLRFSQETLAGFGLPKNSMSDVIQELMG